MIVAIELLAIAAIEMNCEIINKVKIIIDRIVY